MDDLVQFLRDRYDEDEQTARAVEDGSAPWDGQWIADGPNAVRTKNGHVLAYGHQTTDGRNLPMPLNPGLAEHIARHDPARVLREVDAKRRMLDDLLAERHTIVEDCWYTCAAATEERDGDESCDEGRQGGPCDCGRDARVNRRLRSLAQPYADHPDYRDQWRP